MRAAVSEITYAHCLNFNNDFDNVSSSQESTFVTIDISEVNSQANFRERLCWFLNGTLPLPDLPVFNFFRFPLHVVCTVQNLI
jgi:hypothetical protein